jgi:hypothetical protein
VCVTFACCLPSHCVYNLASPRSSSKSSSTPLARGHPSPLLKKLLLALLQDRILRRFHALQVVAERAADRHEDRVSNYCRALEGGAHLHGELQVADTGTYTGGRSVGRRGWLEGLGEGIPNAAQPRTNVDIVVSEEICFEEEVEVVRAGRADSWWFRECVWFLGARKPGLTLWLTGFSYPVLYFRRKRELLPRVSSESSRRCKRPEILDVASFPPGIPACEPRNVFFPAATYDAGDRWTPPRQVGV